MVASGLHMVNPFCPTRLNCADDPTRDTPLRQPVQGFSWSNLSLQELWAIASLRLTKRWASNWIRLVLLLLGRAVTQISDRSRYRWSALKRSTPAIAHLNCSQQVFHHMDSDQTLGLPGEGPRRPIVSPRPCRRPFRGFSPHFGFLLWLLPLLPASPFWALGATC